MPYFALQYQVVEDFADRRMPFRPAHLNQVREAHQRGEIVMAGALADPPEALLIFRGADKSAAERFANNDPYVTQGLVKQWTIRQWTVVVGNDPSETPAGLPPQ